MQKMYKKLDHLILGILVYGIVYYNSIVFGTTKEATINAYEW